MTSPSLELQGAVVARLKGYSGLAALVADRVFDRVPTETKLPYVSWGPEQVVENDAECIRGMEIFLQLDAWSTEPGFVEAKKVAEEVKQALHNFDLSLTANALVSIEHRQTRLLRDPDGLTSHAVIEFVAFVEQP